MASIAAPSPSAASASSALPLRRPAAIIRLHRAALEFIVPFTHLLEQVRLLAVSSEWHATVLGVLRRTGVAVAYQQHDEFAYRDGQHRLAALLCSPSFFRKLVVELRFNVYMQSFAYSQLQPLAEKLPGLRVLECGVHIGSSGAVGSEISCPPLPPLLQRIHFHWSETAWQAEADAILLVVSRLPHLTALTLSMCTYRSRGTAVYASLEPLRQLSGSLRSLTLDYPDYQLLDEQIAVLRSLHQLESLTLPYSETEADTTLQRLLQAPRTLLRLQRVVIGDQIEVL